ncbi:MAG: TolC family protein [Desulfobacteraceae bacterium]|nr:TolC family protein [Desulfobacteraceae bacterium]
MDGLKRRLSLCGMVAVLIWASSAIAADTQISVDALVQEGLANNPELHAAQARWDMLRQKAAQAGTFEDPMLMLKIQNGLVNDPLAFDKDPMTGKVIGISQQIPFAGKRALAKQAAGQDAEAGRWQYEERRLELARMIKENYYRLYYVDQSLPIVERNIHVLENLIRSSETLYSVGKAMQQDVLRAQVELSKMEDMRIGLRQQRASLTAVMNSLLNRPVETAMPEVRDVVIVPLTLSAEKLATMAEQERPQLKNLMAQVEKGKANQALASKEYYPDFNVAFEYMQREPVMTEPGDDMYSLGVSFNLPLQRARRQAMTAEAIAETRMATEELNALRNSIRQNIADGLARLERNRRMAELYHSAIIPQANSALAAALAAYQVGKAEFMGVLDSQMALFNYERQHFEAVAEHQMQLAQLEGVVGVSLPPVEKVEGAGGK